MTQLSRDTSYLLIEDQLDAIGQKYRVHRIIRGAVLWAAGCIISSIAAGLVAHFVGQGSGATIILSVWLAWLLASAGLWILRPMVLRPGAVEMARFVETKVDGLHNGLTNSVLLAQANDIASNPYLPSIFDEVLVATRRTPIDSAVKLADLKPLGIRLAYCVGPFLLLAILMPGAMAHGWRQMFSPTTFVPQVGSMEILDVQPQNATIVKGQSIDISISAQGPETPDAKLYFKDVTPAASPWAFASGGFHLPPTIGADKTLKYSYHIDHVDEAMQFRVEVGRTQSAWYPVNVVKQVKLIDLSLRVTPPTYTKQEPKTIALKGDEIEKTPVAVPQGSEVEVTATIDVPVTAGMLQVGDGAPLNMVVSQQGKRFAGTTTISADSTLAILLTQGGGQIIARLPEPSLMIHCTKDAPPTIEMKWPAADATVTPTKELKLSALVKDDYGIAGYRVLMASEPEQPLTALIEKQLAENPPSTELAIPLEIKPELRQHGRSIRLQLEVTDNRNLLAISKELGPQSATSSIFEIKFRDPQQIVADEKEKLDKLRQLLLDMLRKQQELHSAAVAFRGDMAAMQKINGGQGDLRLMMQTTAQTFAFDESNKIIQKTLLMLVVNPAKEAIDLSASIMSEPVVKEQRKQNAELQTRQRRIISTLESLLAVLKTNPEPTTQATTREGGDLPSKPDALKKLNEALKDFMKQEQRILDQTAGLAKKPVDDWTDQDKKLMDELQMGQEKLDAFMKDKVSDFSKLAEQDMSNADLLKELMEVYSEVTMAKDALKAKSGEMAVAAEDNGLELAKELSSNIEKWLANVPDRTAWTQEDPTGGKTDTPMAELPKELEDMIGDLLEKEEDLSEEMEDANANWTDSADKGIGWDAADGPIADMSAKGVTGNVQPNNNEMGGRAGEGRSGKSQGEFVEETATGKGGRMTPTRLDPTPFQQGQVKDTSKDPVGGATGGGKISGQGGKGLEGPVGPQQKQEMQRLAQKQAELRNTAERLNLKYQLGKYDNFKLLESIALMRRVESDLKSNRYQNAMRRRDVLLDDLDTSKLLLGGRVHVQQDTSPASNAKLDEEINDAMKGQLPAAWSDALKEYYKKLAAE